MKLYLAAAATAALFAQSAGAQTPATASTSPAAQTAIIEAARQDGILRSGAEVPVTLREELTTKGKKLRVGQRIQLEVSSNVMVGNLTVIPAGTPVAGEITEVRNKGMWGKSGYIGGRVLSMRLGDRQVRLTGSFDDKGVTGTAAVVGAVVLIPVVGFFTTGTSAVIPAGSAVKAFLEEDIAFSNPAMKP